MKKHSLTVMVATAMAVMLVGAGPARAQSSVFGGAAAAYANDDYRVQYGDAQRGAYENGYRAGLKRGEQALRDRRPLDIERERDYRNAEDGYNRSYGDRNRYRDTYRGGFAQGYREAYGRRGGVQRVDPNPGRDYGRDTGRDYGRGPGYGGQYGYGTNASFGARQNGLSDGYKKGLDDLNDRKRPDVTRQKWYRSGDHDYDRRYGPKETYRIEYRRGFEEGYQRAFRERRY
jgi:hypothetical protein